MAQPPFDDEVLARAAVRMAKANVDDPSDHYAVAVRATSILGRLAYLAIALSSLRYEQLDRAIHGVINGEASASLGKIRAALLDSLETLQLENPEL
jgi:hypothetical protein